MRRSHPPGLEFAGCVERQGLRGPVTRSSTKENALRLKLGRGAVAATVIATLLVPAVGSVAGPRKKLEQVENKLDQIRQALADDSAEALTLQQRVDKKNELLTELQLEIVAINERSEVVKGELAGAQARIDETQLEIDRIEADATAQAVALYKTGAVETLDALLNAESLVELDESVQMLGIAAQENTGALLEYGRLQVTIRGQHRELFDKQEELRDLVRQKSERMKEVRALRGELSAELEKLRKEMGIKEAREGKLVEDEAALRAKILGAQAASAVQSLGESASGYIWPINGNVTSYYGARWGRMHSGIDIDGYTGQPIVASKAGQVILASYYSGYGLAVIIDHGGGYSTLYAHMSAVNTAEGQMVDQGQLIGYVGCTGSCTGDHLHFEVRVNGAHRDPMAYLP